MKHFKYKKVTKVEKQLKRIVCDCCGKVINGETCGSDITDFSITFGYGSKFDMMKWELDVCDDCLESWVSTFKCQVTKKEYLL